MKKTMLRGFLLLVLLFGLGGLAHSINAQVPERPIDSTVVDTSGYLSSQTIDQIDAENRSWSKTEKQLQIGVLVLDSLDGQDLEALANATFRKWQIGFSGTNNGVLLLIAMEDRAFRLETSDQAATVLTDIQAKRMLDNSREFFRAQDYDNGVLYIVDAIGDLFYGTDRSQARLDEYGETSNESSSDVVGIIILIAIFIIIMFGRSSGGGSGSGRGGGSDLIWWLLLNSSSSSDSYDYDDDFGSGSDSFGGGGWSGGGGGGGGASSGW